MIGLTREVLFATRENMKTMASFFRSQHAPSPEKATKAALSILSTLGMAFAVCYSAKASYRIAADVVSIGLVGAIGAVSYHVFKILKNEQSIKSTDVLPQAFSKTQSLFSKLFKSVNASFSSSVFGEFSK